MPYIAENKCARCGAVLSEDNCRACARNLSGMSTLCIDCEQARFDELEKMNGACLALYFSCIAFDVPCLPLIPPSDFENCDEKWKVYISALMESDRYYRRGKPATFADGETNMRRIFGKDLTESDFLQYVKAQQAKLASLPGTEAQRKRWGTGANMTTEKYDELDRLYEVRADSYRGQTITPQMDDTLMRVAKWSMAADELVAARNYRAAKDVQTMIDKELASEQMRKKDEKPIENLQLDTLVVELEKHGLMKEGKFLTFEETVEALVKNFIKQPKYRYSLDAADQMIFAMYNTMRENADLFIVNELPESLQIEDEHGEFLPEETENEKEARRYAGLAKLRHEKGDEPETASGDADE